MSADLTIDVTSPDLPLTHSGKVSQRKDANGLTPMQKAFCEVLDEYGTPSAAARSVGCTARSARSMAYKWLQSSAVRLAVAKQRELIAEIVSFDRVRFLHRLLDMLDADITELFDMKTGELMPMRKWSLGARRRVVGMDIVKLFETDSEGKRQHVGNVHKIKFLDAAKLLEMIGKHVDVSAFNPDTVVEGDLVVVHRNYSGGGGVEPATVGSGSTHEAGGLGDGTAQEHGHSGENSEYANRGGGGPRAVGGEQREGTYPSLQNSEGPEKNGSGQIRVGGVSEKNPGDGGEPDATTEEGRRQDAEDQDLI